MEDRQELYVSASLLANFIILPWQYRHLALTIILPAILITFNTGCIGGNMKDVKLLTNNDNGK